MQDGERTPRAMLHPAAGGVHRRVHACAHQRVGATQLPRRTLVDREMAAQCDLRERYTDLADGPRLWSVYDRFQ